MSTGGAITDSNHRFTGLRPPWKKGQSGNPSGRPKKLTNALDKALTKQVTRDVAEAIVGKAKEGDVYAFNAIADRLEGKVAQAITGEGGGPVRLQFEVMHVLAPTVPDPDE